MPDRRLILLGTGGSRQIRLTRSRLTLGRAECNDVVVTHPSVSRDHLVVEIRGNGAWVRDLGNTNGTWINGRLMRNAQWLAHRDVVRMGRVSIRYMEIETHAMELELSVK